MFKAKLIAVTQPVVEGIEDVGELIAYCARVSNPANQHNMGSAEKLLGYLQKYKHWSPFEMANAVVEVESPRDIARQLLRHRSFCFQEFCVAGSTKITLELPGAAEKGKRSAYTRTIEQLYELQSKNKKMPSRIRVFDEESKKFMGVAIKEVFKTGLKPTFRITLENGRQIESTKEHKFLTQDGFKSLEEAIGLSLIDNRATMSDKDVAFACNGMPVYQNAEWMAAAKEKSIKDKTGLAGIANMTNVTVHTIRKWLKVHSLQFTKAEVSSYTSAWNLGKFGYSNQRHSAETVAKMRASAKKGSESNLWRGGADRTERQHIGDWCLANRSEFFREANYSCAKCSSHEKLEMHHVLTVAERPDLAYEKENIQVLCKQCHREHHKISGHAKSWRMKSKGNLLTVHWSKVVKVEYIGEQMTYDIEVDHVSHNYVGNGIVTHNSQRYADVTQLEQAFCLRDLRMQDTKNRQNSVETEDDILRLWWTEAQNEILDLVKAKYSAALERGVAKEVARVILPEGLTMSRLYVNGTLRSWIHYFDVRIDAGVTQAEHVELARLIAEQVNLAFPVYKE